VHRQRRWACAVSGIAVLAGATACGDDTDSARGADEATVEIELLAFSPERLEVPAGTTVVWRQRDRADHTVTSGTVEQAAGGVIQQPDGDFDSGSMSTDETYQRSFEEPGTYPYFCVLHPATMRGEIHVT
jgi:plastocyanin